MNRIYEHPIYLLKGIDYVQTKSSTADKSYFAYNSWIID